MQETRLYRMPKQQIGGVVILFLLWLVFAAWQRTEHVHQCRLIHETLSSQAESLSSAVSSGVQSHRWFSPFVQQQLPSTLELLARSKNVLAIAVVVKDGSDAYFIAGDKGRIDFALPVGEHTRDDTLQVVSSFATQTNAPMHREFSEFSNIKGDAFGGITAGIVALPLALAFGVYTI